MKCKSICFCIPARKVQKESKNGDSDTSSSRQKPSHDKPRKGRKTRGHSSTAPGDNPTDHDGDANTAAGPDAGMAVAMMGAAHVSTAAGNDTSGDGSAHGGRDG